MHGFKKQRDLHMIVARLYISRQAQALLGFYSHADTENYTCRDSVLPPTAQLLST